MLGRKKNERQIDSELRFHLEQQVRDLIAAGIEPGEARRRAQLDFGGLEQMKEACRDERQGRWLEEFAQDLRYGLRVLGRARAAVAVSALVVGLGVGANMAAYSITDAFLLRPLRVPDVDRLVDIRGTRQGQSPAYPLTPVDFRELSTARESFEAVAGWYQTTGNLAGEGDPEVVDGMAVSDDFFRVFGVAPAMGRALGSGDFREDQRPVAVISHGLWVRHFASAPDVLEKSVQFRDREYLIVGTMPPEFRYLPETDFWEPLLLRPGQRENRTDAFLRVVGKLRKGVGIERANAELAAHATRLAADFPDTHGERGARALPLAKTVNGSEGAPYMYLLWASSFLVLLIAAANVANLQFARMSLRTRELAVRSALGAGRLRLVRQLLTESAVLGALTCVVGTILAAWTVSTLRAAIPASLTPFLGGWDTFAVSPRVLVYGLAVALLAGVLSGVAPALAASAASPGAALGESERMATSGRKRHRMRGAFVVVQVSLSIVLLMGALAIAIRAQQIGEPLPHTDPDSALTFKLMLRESRYREPARMAEFQRRLMDALAQTPGVTTAAMVTDLPYSGEASGTGYTLEGRPAVEGARPAFAFRQAASERYFAAMHIPVIEGRAFEARDGSDTPRVVIVDKALARREFGEESAVGRRIKLGGPKSEAPWMTIVGVVENVRHSYDNLAPLAMLYQPYAQAPMRAFDVIVRTVGRPLGAVNAARAAIREIDPLQPAYGIRTLQDLYYNQTLGETWSARLIGSMGGLALVLAAMGVFSVVANAAAERQKEVAVRMAFGARVGNVLWMTLRQGVGLAVAGAVLGIAGAAAFCELLAAAMPGVVVPEAWLFCAAAVFLVVVAIPACIVPARRAALADPAAVLRAE